MHSPILWEGLGNGCAARQNRRLEGKEKLGVTAADFWFSLTWPLSGASIHGCTSLVTCSSPHIPMHPTFSRWFLGDLGEEWAGDTGVVGAGSVQEREGGWLEKLSRRKSQDVEVETTWQDRTACDRQLLTKNGERGREALRGTRRAWSRGMKTNKQTKTWQAEALQGLRESPFEGGYQIPVFEDTT